MWSWSCPTAGNRGALASTPTASSRFKNSIANRLIR
jgi:hypothetical protein